MGVRAVVTKYCVRPGDVLLKMRLKKKKKPNEFFICFLTNFHIALIILMIKKKGQSVFFHSRFTLNLFSILTYF